jgi:hypothetical protein
MSARRSGMALRGVGVMLATTLAMTSAGQAQKPDNAEPAWHPDDSQTCRHVLQAYPSPHLVVGVNGQNVTCSNDQRYPAIYMPMRPEQWRWYQTHEGHRLIYPNERPGV